MMDGRRGSESRGRRDRSGDSWGDDGGDDGGDNGGDNEADNEGDNEANKTGTHSSEETSSEAKDAVPQLPTHIGHDAHDSHGARLSRELSHDHHGRRSLSYAQRPQAEVYYDSRAATRSEWKRRARTLEEYYQDNPKLLPQLPFTWRHGRRRWRLIMFAFIVFVDASAMPIALYYGMYYSGHVEGFIIFAVVTSIWGGPTYLELAVRTLRLIRKERFYRPLGTDNRWCFDMLTWVSVLTTVVVTALFIVGSAPHEVWLRVLCMPAPAILYCVGGSMAAITLFHAMDWPAPFRISSTPRGGRVHAAVYYFIEDVVAVNAGAGRPYREALAARYRASPHFRRMLHVQSLFWSIPALVLAVPLTVIAVISPVPATAAYGVCWAVPFLWAALWGAITVIWCKREMLRERIQWEAAGGIAASRSEAVKHKTSLQADSIGIPHSGQTEPNRAEMGLPGIGQTAAR
ncbi:hypothetical protein CDD81_860 [Ophiocordyceps australis]|uniref:Uncharacterized protein n=1 Tax=Ophiocordyceps australis TaxID=1399860 RepID=A0A2C5YF47_9HYPO|nr:hypothetical protein CDD81_860 [Ophiocordyceps australis]